MIWFWFALAIITLIFELATGIFYFLVLSIAFFITGFYTYFFEASPALSTAFASLLALIGLVIVATINKKKKKDPKNYTPQDLDIGQLVVIEEHLPNGLYYVHYRGTLWEAALDDNTKIAAVGDKASIIGKDANTLIIQLT
ncbi:MAG: NfeD family protein [Neisseriaceae bacterium]|nr:NfeD family protein [Neisseriaceae bacterium]